MNFLISTLALVLGYLFILSFAAKLSEGNSATLKKLYLFHILFGVYFCFFVQGDAIGYWKYAKLMSHTDFIYSLTQNQGTYFIMALNYYPSNILDLSYFTGTILYSIIGFIGLTYFYVVAIELIPNDPKFSVYYLFPLLFFLPNLHFWSCAVGKDTLLFFCIGIFTYGLLEPFRRMPLLILGLGLSYFIRPHITLFLLLGFGMAYFSGRNISIFQRILFFGLMIGIAITILPTVLEFAKVEEATLDSFDKFSETKAALLSRSSSDSAVDISSYPFPLKVFTFLFRPFFFDIKGIPSVLASLENLLLLVLTITVLKNKPLNTFKNAPFIIQGMVYFLIIGTIAFCQSLGNIGIMIRMRNMFLPGLIIFILWHFSYQQSQDVEP
ncbi:hypothetical protein [Flavobacterium sp.]|uniref:hypothetical protein n=1 Tax=Flavobacterium sp. TaxID=239 RepID=UPI00286A21C5|nr:hypothetical protein [Flavobacterium sp.]